MKKTAWKNRIISATKAVGTYRDAFLPMMAKNPLLVSWGDMNTSALSYWRDLGLTPAGLKKIDESAIKGKKMSALGDILRDIGG